MNLTDYIRDAFVRAVMQDVPKPDYAKLKADAQKALLKAMSPAVRKAYVSAPGCLKTERFDRLVESCAYVALPVGDLDSKIYNAIVAEFQQPATEREQLVKKLHQIAKGVKTVKQLRLQLPELAHYLPDDKLQTVNLPATANVVADMVEMGWTGKEIRK